MMALTRAVERRVKTVGRGGEAMSSPKLKFTTRVTQFLPGDMGLNEQERTEKKNKIEEEEKRINDMAAALRRGIEERIAKPQDEDVQDELSRLVRLISLFAAKRNESALKDIELALGALEGAGADKKTGMNIEFARGIRKELEDQENLASAGWFGAVYHLAGRSPIRAVVVGTGVSFLVAWVALELLFIGMRSAQYFSGGEVTPFSMNVAHLIQQYGWLLAAAFIGSITSIAVRLEEFAKFRRHDPLLFFLTGFYKPWIGMAFAVFLYAVLRTELISIAGIEGEQLKSGYFMVVLGFLCGFSERIAKDVISRLENKVGSNQQPAPGSPPALPRNQNPSKPASGNPGP